MSTNLISSTFSVARDWFHGWPQISTCGSRWLIMYQLALYENCQLLKFCLESFAIVVGKKSCWRFKRHNQDIMWRQTRLIYFQTEAVVKLNDNLKSFPQIDVFGLLPRSLLTSRSTVLINSATLASRIAEIISFELPSQNRKPENLPHWSASIL